MDAFEQWARGGLELNGIGLDDGELDLLRFLHEAYRPALDALDGVDLAAWAPEPDLDPSRAPRDRT